MPIPGREVQAEWPRTLRPIASTPLVIAGSAEEETLLRADADVANARLADTEPSRLLGALAGASPPVESCLKTSSGQSASQVMPDDFAFLRAGQLLTRGRELSGERPRIPIQSASARNASNGEPAPRAGSAASGSSTSEHTKPRPMVFGAAS